MNNSYDIIIFQNVTYEFTLTSFSFWSIRYNSDYHLIFFYIKYICINTQNNSNYENKFFLFKVNNIILKYIYHFINIFDAYA